MYVFSVCDVFVIYRRHVDDVEGLEAFQLRMHEVTDCCCLLVSLTFCRVIVSPRNLNIH